MCRGRVFMTSNPVLPDMAPNPMLARLVVEEHFRSLSLIRRLVLAVRMILITRPPRAGVIDASLNAHLRADIGLPSAYDRADPPKWYPPPIF